MSLSSAVVDLDRTHRYADAIRLVHYAATRGELDYAAMTQEAQRAIAELTTVTDPRRRLAMARGGAGAAGCLGQEAPTAIAPPTSRN